MGEGRLAIAGKMYQVFTFPLYPQCGCSDLVFTQNIWDYSSEADQPRHHDSMMSIGLPSRSRFLCDSGAAYSTPEVNLG